MKVLDPGHQYMLDSFDGGAPILLTFVKRDTPPELYPGNVGHYPGTQIQEVLRALIDRGVYLESQIPCAETKRFIDACRYGLIWLEERIRRMRQQPNLPMDIHTKGIENQPTCTICGHIMCLSHTAGGAS